MNSAIPDRDSDHPVRCTFIDDSRTLSIAVKANGLTFDDLKATQDSKAFLDRLDIQVTADR